MKIEVGKYYVNREGNKVGPMRWDDYGGHFPWDVSGTRYMYSENGKCDEGSDGDLIEEWGVEKQTFLAAVEQLGLEYGMVLYNYTSSDDGCIVSFEVDE